MAERLIIHAGVHKTATTALQDMMTEAVPRAAPERAYWFPRQTIRQRMIQPLRDGNPAPLIEAVRERPEPIVYLSEENIAGFVAPEERALYPQLGDRLRMIAEGLDGMPVDVVVVVRDWATFLPSAYIEYLRFWPYVPFAEFLAAFEPHSLSWREVLRFRPMLSEAVRLHVVPYEKERGGGFVRIVRTMLELGDVQYSHEFTSVSAKVVRPGLTARELAIIEGAGRISRGAASQLVRRLSSDRIAGLKAPLTGSAKYQPFSADERGHWSAVYDKDLAVLGEQLRLGRQAD